MNIAELHTKALAGEWLTKEEGVFLYENDSISNLSYLANTIKTKIHNHNYVGWIIDRNVNITNACISGCKFCSFHCGVNSKKLYITTHDEYVQKLKELVELGGDQILLQGGLHPDLGLKFYKELFEDLKNINPNVKLHSLGPPEIVHISNLESLSYKEVLDELIASGLDSLPGAGAEILSDRVRSEISPGKCLTKPWLDVMREAHKLNMVTSATMMFGHIETVEERIDHFVSLRQVQSEKDKGNHGFVTFVPWPCQPNGTTLQKRYGIDKSATASEYIKLIAISRIMLPNIPNIQASWLTVGKEVGQLALNSGANDFGSIMIEENVVASTGSFNKFDASGICNAIEEAGFTPRKRNQAYEWVE